MGEEAQSPPARPSESPAPGASPEAAEPEPDWATRYKYLLAEFDNFRRRAEREKEAARQSARAEVVRSLLPLFEASEQAQ
jgi:molecular chaperone GrpE (heat shock protein)